MTSPKTPNRLSGRNKIITVASIGAVGLAGLFAIGANLGSFSSAGPSKVGTVAEAGDPIPTDTRVVDVYLDEQGNPLATDPAASEPAAPAGSQRFTVDSVGSVDVSALGGTARVDLITPASGWTATPATTTATGVAVTFTDGTRTLQFTATVGPDGAVIGDVTEPRTGSPTALPTSQRDDDHESDDDESDDYESVNHEYEGGESDD